MRKRRGIIWGVIGGFTVLVGTQVFRGIRIIKKMKSLKQGLSEFLTEVYGLEPQLSVNVAVNIRTKISIKVRYPEELLANSPDLEADIYGYIEENFLELAKYETVITLLPLEEEEEEIEEEFEEEDE
ncbi:MAG: hypothetical protein WCY64_02770 [Candidatus Cloacimonadaceae bacterium]